MNENEEQKPLLMDEGSSLLEEMAKDAEHSSAWDEILTPHTKEDAWKLAQNLAKSQMTPKRYQGNPFDIAIAIAMGAKLGLDVMSSLVGIAVINGTPAVYGKTALALVQSHPEFEDMEEVWDEANQRWTVTVKRTGKTPKTDSFSMDDAKKAGLLGKSGPWAQYPRRMCLWRARNVMHDQFADLFSGVSFAEEFAGSDMKARRSQAQDLADSLGGEG